MLLALLCTTGALQSSRPFSRRLAVEAAIAASVSPLLIAPQGALADVVLPTYDEEGRVALQAAAPSALKVAF